VAGTDLIATLPRRMALGELHNPAIKILPAPAEMTGFKYLMAWHPRVNTDAAHVWLRSMVRSAAKALADPPDVARPVAEPRTRRR
jgi:DNA-binding transcriptional LysR family regulator